MYVDANQNEKPDSGILLQHHTLNILIVIGLFTVLIINAVILNSSIFMYTINLFLETICFLYVAKYFEYEGYQKAAMLL